MAKLTYQEIEFLLLLLQISALLCDMTCHCQNQTNIISSQLNLLLFIFTVATVALIAPCLDIDRISELSNVNFVIPAMTDFFDKELMLQRVKLNEPMIVLSENAPLSILFIDTSLNAMSFM